MLLFKKLRYRHKIALIMFVFTLLPMLILGWFLTEKIWSSKVKDILAEKNAQLTSSVNGINSVLSSNVNKILYINNNYYLINYLETNADQNLMGRMYFNDYLQSMIGAVNSDNFQADIAIYTLKDTNYDGEHLRSISRLESKSGSGKASLKDEILHLGEDQILWMIREEKLNLSSNVKTDYIFGYKKIISLNKPLAIIEMRIPISQLLHFFPYEISKGSFIVLEENSGKYRLNMAGVEEQQSSSDNDYELTQELQQQIGKVTWYIPKSLIFQELKWYWASVAVILMVIVITLLLTVEVVSHYLTRKLEILLRQMNKKVESLINDEETIHALTAHDEFGKIGHSFYELLSKVKEYYRRITEFELERKVLETQLLQERFNPHFLYNTLSTIRWISDDKRVKDVVSSMVKYYRIALNKGESIITISQELKMIEEYLRLQKFAYGTDFEYVIDQDEDIGHHLILKHLLQPVVENAVLHGLDGRESGGVIRIVVAKQREEIVFEIADNGTGIEEDKLQNILQGMSDGLYGGYGMKNIRKRLETYYGNGYGLEIQSISGEGTKVSFRVPVLLDAADLQPNMNY